MVRPFDSRRGLLRIPRRTLAPMVALSPRPARTVLIPVLIPHRLRILGPEQVLYSITKHAMRRSADEIAQLRFHFGRKSLAIRRRLLTEFFPPIEFARVG